MRLHISTSAVKKTSSLIIEAVKTALGPAKYKKLLKWVAQEKVKQDSADYYTKGTDADADLLDIVYDVLIKHNYPGAKSWNEPYRGSLDAMVKLLPEPAASTQPKPQAADVPPAGFFKDAAAWSKTHSVKLEKNGDSMLSVQRGRRHLGNIVLHTGKMEFVPATVDSIDAATLIELGKLMEKLGIHL